MKKNRVTLLVAFLLIAAASFFIIRNNSSTFRKEDRDFAIADTSSITKLFIADRNTNSVTLERKSAGEWMLNSKHEARQQGINLILDCLKKIRVQSRIPKNSYNTIIKELSSSGIKFEVYTNNSSEPTKVYFIGGSTQDVLGTYMMLSNSTVPFITEMPGFSGYLTPRFSPKERDWRIPVMFRLQREEIKSVTLEYQNRPEKSFMLEMNGNSPRVFSPVNHQQVLHVDTLHVSNYLESFRHLYFETWDRFLTDKETDSLRNTIPVTILTVVDSKGTKTVVPMYLKPTTESSLAQTDSAGNPLKYDIDRMYAFVNDGKELITVQFFVFNKVFAGISDFDLDAAKRKFQQ